MSFNVYNNKLLLFNEFIKTKSIKCYKNRVFNHAYNVLTTSYSIQQHQHIKMPSNSNYLVFDVDYCNEQHLNNIFYNNFDLLPNFVIREYSTHKGCYTLQIFYQIDKLKINDDFIQSVYKKLCLFFGADLNYQLKTGIHKNLMFEKYTLKKFVNTNFENLDCVYYLHNSHYNVNKLTSVIHNLELFNELPVDAVFVNAANAIPSKIPKVPQNSPKQQANTNLCLEGRGDVGQRNVTLFNQLRFFAYSANDKTYKNLLEYATKVNNKFKIPLPGPEVSATVKSVFNYVNKTKSKNKNNNAFFNDEARIKSSTTRSISAIKQIKNAVFILKKQNKQVSINAVNKITNQDKRTIKKYLNDILTTIENKEQNNNKLLPIMTVIENSVSKNELITPIHNNTS